MFFDRLDYLCRQNKTTPTALSAELGFARGSVTKWKDGAVPSSDIVVKIASHFRVPTDFLLENGVFKQWDVVLRHKESVYRAVSDMISKITEMALSNIDDMTLMLLVDAFGVEVSDDEGLEIFVRSPVLHGNITDPTVAVDALTQKQPTTQNEQPVENGHEKLIRLAQAELEALPDSELEKAAELLRVLRKQ